MKKQPLLWMTIAAALLSGCTGHREHHPQVTFTVDTVRTDTTASNPICLAEKYGSLLNERHPDLFAGAQGSISRSAFFNDSLTLTPETLHGMIQNTPCVESMVTSVGPDTFTADVSPGVRMQVSPDIHGAPGNITLRLSTTDQKRKQTVEQSISLRPEQSLVVNGFTGDGAGEKRVVLITPHVR
ncbi:hypothetical protein KQO57_001629 [Escherichia coli]|nr:hypothetical protein [Escherichia coli]EKK9340462.1 hypothetical protein [Salmonella enterica]